MKRFAIILAGCAPAAPAAPSYQEHVAPILAANCVRCHGLPQIGGAPAEFVLDRAGDTTAGGYDLAGAITMAANSAARVGAGDMPPRFPIDDYQVETLENWARDPERRPRPGNYAPSAAIADTLQTITEEGFENRVDITITLRLDDEDLDLVAGQLRVAGTFVALLRTGTNVAVWNATDRPTGDYPAEVTLDDGAGEIVQSLGTVHVEAP